MTRRCCSCTFNDGKELNDTIQFLDKGSYRIAYFHEKSNKHPGHAPDQRLGTIIENTKTPILFLNGYRSDMSGRKVAELRAYCKESGRDFITLDYRGHGQSIYENVANNSCSTKTITTTSVEDFVLGDWVQDSLDVYDHCCGLTGRCSDRGPDGEGDTLLEATELTNNKLEHTDAAKPERAGSILSPTREAVSPILVGSSMGAWISMLIAERRKVAGIVAIAAAINFTLEWERELLDSPGSSTCDSEQEQYFNRPSLYSLEPYRIPLRFLEEARQCWLIQHTLDPRKSFSSFPIHWIHGKEDPDISWESSIQWHKWLQSSQITLIEDGDHRLSRPSDLKVIRHAIHEMATEIDETKNF